MFTVMDHYWRFLDQNPDTKQHIFQTFMELRTTTSSPQVTLSVLGSIMSWGVSGRKYRRNNIKCTMLMWTGFFLIILINWPESMSSLKWNSSCRAGLYRQSRISSVHDRHWPKSRSSVLEAAPHKETINSSATRTLKDGPECKQNKHTFLFAGLANITSHTISSDLCVCQSVLFTVRLTDSGHYV